ncbi:hypothetical protein [Planctobacterium marinum]|uniref:Uncharacterized protein n=1 Tax=Planctobacterium marinum TaxID=1631968 RepID=A0AA48KUK3_9ALTE|nr:hypothetical protein MACH26_41950 [Planctobacterium marinum]
MAKIANPQGKGNHLLSNHWFEDVQLQVKSADQIFSDYILSMLVLSAEFSFKPVPDNEYFLYLWKGQLRLSLIPARKCNFPEVECLAVCFLNADLTWKVILHPQQALSSKAKEWLQNFAEAMQSQIERADSFRELLPYYEESLPFYRRLYASGLAKSLTKSAQKIRLLDKKPELPQSRFLPALSG